MIIVRNKCSVKFKVNGRPQAKRVNKINVSYSSDMAAMAQQVFMVSYFYVGC
jgi:hypothetical protein